MPWVSAKKFICPPWWALPGLLWCALLYHLLLVHEIVGFNRQPLSSWDVTPFQRRYIAMYCGISEMFWGASDDCLELIVDGQEDSRSLCLTSFLVHFRMQGSSRIAFFLKHPHKQQAAGCLPMTHAKAGYNRVCWLCHTVWSGVVTTWQQDKCKILCQRVCFQNLACSLPSHSARNFSPRCHMLSSWSALLLRLYL